MSEDKLDFLDGQPAEVMPEPTEPVVLAEPKADKGEPPAQEPVSAPPAEPPKEQSHVVPLAALIDTRRELQDIKRENEELRARFQQQEAAQQAGPPPDPRVDPDGALAYERAVFQAQLTNTHLQTSRFLAEKDHGAELVAEAFAFFDRPENRPLSHQLKSHPSPFHAAVEYYKRQKLAEEVGSDPAAYEAKIEARLRDKILAELQPQLAQPKPRLPGSLAAAPAAGVAGEPAAKGTAFDAAFG